MSNCGKPAQTYACHSAGHWCLLAFGLKEPGYSSDMLFISVRQAFDTVWQCPPHGAFLFLVFALQIFHTPTIQALNNDVSGNRFVDTT